METPDKKVNTYLRFASAGIQMGSVIGLSAWLGVWLDRKYNQDGQLYTVICSLFGVAAGLYIVLKEVIKLSK